MWGGESSLARLDRTVDRITPEMRDLERAQDGTEVKAWELETLTDRARNLGDRRDAFEKMRDIAAEAYLFHTGDVWHPRHGSHASQTGTLTSAASDFRRARKDRETRAQLPDGTLVAIAGGKTVADADAVWTTLDADPALPALRPLLEHALSQSAPLSFKARHERTRSLRIVPRRLRSDPRPNGRPRQRNRSPCDENPRLILPDRRIFFAMVTSIHVETTCHGFPTYGVRDEDRAMQAACFAGNARE